MRHLMTYFTGFVLLVTGLSSAQATIFDIHTATGAFAPSFRGDVNTTYVGWDSFGDPGDTVINDSTPDLGTDGGSFVTTNSENHLSSSLNYYSGFGTVAEDISFSTSGTAGSGYTTVIVQIETTFGSFNPAVPVQFSTIEGVVPTIVLGDNAIPGAPSGPGGAQLFAKYELLNAPTNLSLSLSSISSPGGTHLPMGKFVVDTVWSATGFSSDTAVNTPEPSTALLALFGLSLLATQKRGEQ